MEKFRFIKQGNTLKFYGTISEFTDFKDILSDIDEITYIDLSYIFKINTLGARTWIDNIIAYKGKIVFKNCSIPIVEQLNIVPELIGSNVIVESFLAPYFCEDCDFSEDTLLIIDDHIDYQTNEIMVGVSCPHCNNKMNPDFDEEDYLFFINRMQDKASFFKERFSSELNNDANNSHKESKTRSSRKPLSTTVQIFNKKIDGNFNETPYITFTENICIGGLLIYSFKKFNPGDIIRVEFDLPQEDNKHKIISESEIKWVEDEDSQNNIPRFGIEFINLDDNYKKLIDNYVLGFTK